MEPEWIQAMQEELQQFELNNVQGRPWGMGDRATAQGPGEGGGT